MGLFKKKQTRQEIVAERRQKAAKQTAANVQSEATPVQDERFRRSRTLSGRSADDIAQSDRTKVHVLRKKQRSLASVLLGVLGVVAVLVLLVTQLITRVDVSLYGSLERGLEANKASDFSSVMDEYFLTHPLERFRALLNTDSLVAYLQSHGHAEVRDVRNVENAGVGVLALQFKIREPIASWTVDGARKYVDNTGVIFDKNYYSQPPRIQIVDESGVPATAVKAVASARFLGFVGMSVGYFTDQKIVIKKVVIPSGVTRQVQFVTSDDTVIKMATDRAVGVQAEDAVRALAHMKGSNIKVQYLDVRVSGRVFYK